MQTRTGWTIGGVALLAVAVGVIAPSLSPVASLSADRAPVVDQAQAGASLLDGLPLAFEPNRGQATSDVQFVGRARDALILVRSDGATVVAGPGASPVHMVFVGGAASARVTSGTDLPGRVSYLKGADPQAWIRGLPTFRDVRIREVYAGVDAVFHGAAGNLEFDFVVRPGADPGQVKLAFDGAQSVELQDDGSLVVRVPGGEARLQAPVVYQDGSGGRTRVPGWFHVLASGDVAFEVADYDRSVALVIDPVLTYSSYVGAAGDDAVEDVVVSPNGDVFVAGWTTSSAFPSTPLTFRTAKGDASGALADGFVMKLDPTLKLVQYATYLGGVGEDRCIDIALGPDGAVYVSGDTDSGDFPLQAAHTSSKSAGSVAFLARLADGGQTLDFSTYAPSGSNGGLAADVAGSPYHVVRDDDGALVRKYTATGSSISYSTAVGANEAVFPHSAHVDTSGNVVVGGSTGSSNFPTTAGVVQGGFGGGGAVTGDGFVFKLDSSGTLSWATFLGGSGDDGVHDVTTDASGNVFAVGETASSNFPTASAEQAATGGGADGFVVKLSADGRTRSYATYLGGSGDDAALAVTVDDCGNATVTGRTASSNFPLEDERDDSLGGSTDAFVTRYSDAGVLDYSTYHGGSGDDAGLSVDLGDGGDAIVVGCTESSGFPTTGFPIQAVRPGQVDGFLSALQSGATGFSVTTASLPQWTLGEMYDEQLALSGGTGPFSWTVAGGEIPSGTTLDLAGRLSGEPDVPGAYTFRAMVTGDCGLFAVRTLSVIVNPRPLFLTAGLPAWTVSFDYPQTFVTNGGTRPLTFAVVDGEIPSGQTFLDDGRLEGSLDTASTYVFTVEVTDALGVAVEKEFTVVVNPLPTISTTALRDCTEGRPYDETLEVVGGTGPFSWSLDSGRLPAAAQVDAATGRIQGLTKTEDTYDSTIRVVDAIGAEATKSFSASVNPPVEILTPFLPVGARGRPYVSAILSRGGTAPVKFSVFRGAMPAGLAIDVDTGDVSGVAATEGVQEVNIRVTDACGDTQDATFTMPIGRFFPLTNKPTRVELPFAPGEVEEYLFFLDLVAETSLDVTAKLVGKGTLPATLEMLDARGDPVDVGGQLRARKKKVQLKKVQIPLTDRYFVRLRATTPFEGVVRFDVKPTARAKFTGEGLVKASGVFLDAVVPALAGSFASVKVKRAKKSFVTPIVQAISDNGGVPTIEPNRVKATKKSSSYKRSIPLLGGVFSARLVAKAGTEGNVVWTIKLKRPKVYDFELGDLASGFVALPEDE